ncbi:MULTISPECIES: hypothetical protein [unclassified Caballeronia]|uniref:hypothetical protein n=1 Tax=unclassified Caballeronia TaxID=2646786 RepID=UPI002865859D|nr:MULTISPECIES: hypothetical protein [unclassified Caballeronia]MDR5774816.1 hypothetical protein [Caballeronia sp. LZ002]MDR5850252.1 hypothetical protein [Caballeronia sp. LZ003]
MRGLIHRRDLPCVHAISQACRIKKDRISLGKLIALIASMHGFGVARTSAMRVCAEFVRAIFIDRIDNTSRSVTHHGARKFFRRASPQRFLLIAK